MRYIGRTAIIGAKLTRMNASAAATIFRPTEDESVVVSFLNAITANYPNVHLRRLEWSVQCVFSRGDMNELRFEVVMAEILNTLVSCPNGQMDIAKNSSDCPPRMSMILAYPYSAPPHRFTIDAVTRQETLDMLHVTAEVKGGGSGLKKNSRLSRGKERCYHEGHWGVLFVRKKVGNKKPLVHVSELSQGTRWPRLSSMLEKELVTICAESLTEAAVMWVMRETKVKLAILEIKNTKSMTAKICPWSLLESSEVARVMTKMAGWRCLFNPEFMVGLSTDSILNH